MYRKSPILAIAVYFFLTACACVYAQSGEIQVVEKRVHVVQKGQVSVEIGKKHGLSLEELAKLNPGRDLKKLQIGDELVVGEKPVEKTQPAVPQAAPVKQEAKESFSSEAKPSTPASRPDKIALMEEMERNPPPAKTEPGTAVTAFDVILKLAIVVGLAYIVLLGYKKISDKQDASPRLHRNMRVVDVIRLSNTSTIHLVEIEGKKLLIGSSANQVNLLSEFEPITEQTLPSEASEESSEPKTASTEGKFADYLQKYSAEPFKNTPAGRIAGLLRDVTTYLQERRRKLSTEGVKGANNADAP